MALDRLRPHTGAKKSKKRVGRGDGSGHGKTACRGEKGQRARTGGSISPGFEGGQMPLYRQLPKRGFKNPFKKIYGVLNIKDLEAFPDGSVIDIESAKKSGLMGKRFDLLKILSEGDIHKAIIVKAHAASSAAIKKIEAAGGRVELLSDNEVRL
ncbi:MAG: 50S ribosomal protein L15 [Dissulfurimicrobium sp.]|uniref:50S ribosomal protein L15 n=1 Tax=Dissulfurimicrobium TaxID=1769732 RepID=UPI001EDC85D5|nr:50S ribosomal protein L15 [Dissulfurimicrobium hydrothermale]UKL14606.1 50S ribosomal protein L15 [Dissulfurimicrobium hydrothermale]